MKNLRTVWLKVRSLGQRRVVKQEIDEELRFHIEQRTAENIAAGMPPVEAAWAARKRFGNVQSVREECRDVRGTSFGETTWRDVKFGVRMLRKSPGFTAIAVLTLAIGIGGNTAIFSLINEIIVKPFAYRDSERVVQMGNRYSQLFGSKVVPISPQGYFDYVSKVKSFESVALKYGGSGNLTGVGVPEVLTEWRVTASFFSIMSVTPALGRCFTLAEEQPGNDHVVMLSHHLWQRRFGGDSNVLGRTLIFNDRPYQVVGVLPSTFKMSWAVEIWRPLTFTPQEKQDRGGFMQPFGKLKPGATLAQAQSELDAMTNPIRDASKNLIKNDWRILARPMKEMVIEDNPVLLLLMGSVVIVLLIACVNIANLQLVRGVGRQKEIAIRLAMGASRLSLTRQLLTENLLLALLGGAGGFLLGFSSLKIFAASLPQYAVQLTGGTDGIPLDGRILLFTLGASLLCGLLFGIAPAWQAFRFQVNSTLKEAGSGANVGVGHQRLRTLMVGAQVALALILLTGAGLLLKSFVQITRVDPGFNPENLLSLIINLSGTKYDAEKRQQFFDTLVERVRQLPGTKAAAVSTIIPLWKDRMWNTSFNVEGFPESGLGAPGGISPGFFQTMQIGLRSGRDFTPADTSNSLPVIIVDEKIARCYWPNQSPIGKRIVVAGETVGGKPLWREIVGVVGHTKIYGLDNEGKEQFYFPNAQYQVGKTTEHLLMQFLVVRTEGDPDRLIESIRKAVLAIDPNQPIHDVKTVSRRRDESLATRRIPMLLVAIFAGVALVLSVIGLYGVMAYTTKQRAREFAIRVALGAERRNLIQLVLRQVMIVVGIGMIVGLLGAVALGRLLESLLVGVATTDPATFVGVSFLLAAVALLACYFPARRAAKVDPMMALRCE